MTIEISDEIIDREIKKYIDKKITVEIKRIFDEKVQEEVKKREEKAYRLFIEKADEIFGVRLKSIVERAVHAEVSTMFNKYGGKWEEAYISNEAFARGVHTAYLAMAEFPSDKTIDRALEVAGEYLAEQIRMNPQRYKRLTDVLIENMQKDT